MTEQTMRHEQAVASRAAERYLLDEMSELERHRFEAHYFSCPECAEDIRVGVALQEAASEPLTPGQSKPNAWPRPLRLVSLAAAAALVMTVGYQSLFVIPELQSMARPQALAPVVLRPVSRGADTPITLPAGASFLSMSLDVNLDPLPSELQYDLATDQGIVVASGRVAAPAPGTPLLLLVPSKALSAGRYALTLRPADGSAGTLAYRFVASTE
jgi:anti-sigma factor RsiW